MRWSIPARFPGRRSLVGALTGLVVAGAAALTTQLGLLDKFELLTVDQRMLLTADPERVSGDLLVVTIDDGTVRELEGQQQSWPPERWFWADLIRSIDTLGARAIVLDVTFSDLRETALYVRPEEPFRRCDPSVLDCSLAHTLFMAKTAWETGNVVLAVSTVSIPSGADDHTQTVVANAFEQTLPYVGPRLPLVEGRAVLESRSDDRFVRRLQLPEPRILVGARALGFADLAPTRDADEVVRRFAPAVRIGDRTVPDLPVAAFAVAASEPGTSIAWEEEDRPPAADARGPLAPLQIRDRAFSIAGRTLPLREDGTAWMRWRGNWADPGSPLRRHVLDATNLLRDRDRIALHALGVEDYRPEEFDPAIFRDKVVFVGYTMQGEQRDQIGTPFGVQPGVFKHVTAYDTLASGNGLASPPAWMDVLLMALLSMGAGALVLGLPDFVVLQGRGAVLQTLVKVLPGAGILLAWDVGAVAAFDAGWVLNVFHTSAAVGLTTMTSAVLAYVFIGREERRQRVRVHGLLTRAFSKEVAAEALAREERGESIIGGRKHDLTLYFSDIAGFTTISEKLPPEELVRILNEYLTKVTDLFVHRHRAYVDKYIGDAIMAFWGAPVDEPEGPVLACLAAIDAMEVMEEYSRELAEKGLPPLRTRIGINTGPAVAGFIGHPDRYAYTALGDTVNLAARLEGANKAYGTGCMIGPETFERARHAIVARELDLVRVKGKNIPVRVYELIGRAGDPLPERRALKERYETALALFRDRRFEEAAGTFGELAESTGDGASRTMLERCRERIAEPPPEDWDGSNELTEK